jgi:DNA-binding transcriptional LysR family regulator
MRHLRLLQQVVEIAKSGSIRKAAEKLNITPSAMNRRIQDLEAEVGGKLFERLPRGVRMTAVGEMFLRYARRQLADAERFNSQVEDLRGLRRGPVSIACSQALAYNFLAQQIAAFRRLYPRLIFTIAVIDHAAAIQALHEYKSDLALVFKPRIGPSVRVLTSIPQKIVAIMRKDHPLAARRSLRVSDCSQYPVALPDTGLSGRRILDEVAAKRDIRFNIIAESNSFEMLRGLVLRSDLISFQIAIGTPSEDIDEDLIGLEIDERDIPSAELVLCQLRGRTLPVAAATFAEKLSQELKKRSSVPQGQHEPPSAAGHEKSRPHQHRRPAHTR